MDRQSYVESWKEAAAYFRNAVEQPEWTKTQQAVRAPLGNVVSRAFNSANYRTTLPGAPDGEYVVVEFDTRFQHKQKAVETVIPMKEEDGSWRISGYFIR